MMKLSKNLEIEDKNLYWFKFPEKNTENIEITHYSYFEKLGSL